MTNHPINDALAANEATFEIDLFNSVTGTTYTCATVHGANTMGQIIGEYYADLGVNPKDEKLIFMNKRTAATTSDTNETVEGLGLQAGDVLAISDDGHVAADEEVFEINLLNKETGTTYPRAAVCGANTLGQVLEGYAADIGVNPEDSKVIFTNKRTMASTCDTAETIEGLGLQAGDVLAISDDGHVAADEEAFEIDLLNKVTGITYPRAAVYGANTLGQILQEYGADLSVDLNYGLFFFENKRSGEATDDTNKMVEDLGLHEGDVLVIAESCRGVA